LSFPLALGNKFPKSASDFLSSGSPVDLISLTRIFAAFGFQTILFSWFGVCFLSSHFI